MTHYPNGFTHLFVYHFIRVITAVTPHRKIEHLANYQITVAETKSCN